MGRGVWLLTLLLAFVPAGQAGVWNCTANPIAQAVVSNGGSNSYSTILTWDFGSRTFTTAIANVSFDFLPSKSIEFTDAPYHKATALGSSVSRVSGSAVL